MNQRSHEHGMIKRGLVLALTAMAAIVLALAAYASGQQELQVQVDECSGYDGTPRDGDCSSQTETVAPQEAPKPAPAPASSSNGPIAGETHDLNLETGASTVRTADGEVTSETLDYDLSLTGTEEQAQEDSREAKRVARRTKKLLAQDTGLPTVSTSGGSQFAGFGADMISGDEALSRFAVPPFLVPIYVAAGRAYNVPWNLLAAINQIETDFGRIRRQVSYAGAIGWMQFMPGTWRAYGVDASGDGIADPFNPVDAIYAAARYLAAAGAPGNLRRAVFAYNHADWYVDRVLKTAGIYGSLPSGLLAEAGSLAYGRFPVLGHVSYTDDFRRAQAAGLKPRGLWIDGRGGTKAIATQGVKVKRVLLDRRLARIFVHDGLAKRGVKRPANSPAVLHAAAGLAGKGTKPAQAATVVRPRPSDALPKGYGISRVPGLGVEVEDPAGNAYRYSGLATLATGVRPGAHVSGGAPLGQLDTGKRARMLFSVRAAGGAPVDPRPLVDGYRLQEAADFYNAVAPLGDNPFVPDGSLDAVQGVSGTQRALGERVLSDPGIQIYPGGREDIRRGLIDKRVLGALLYLRRNGIDVTVSCLRSGHSFYTAGGNVSAHSFGAAVDIGAFNGQPVYGHQGPGSLTEQAIKLLMRLQGSAQPSQLISLMTLGGPSFAMGDHDDHLHVGYTFQQSIASGRSGEVLGRVDFQGSGVADVFSKAKVSRQHEDKLSRRLGAIENPEVSRHRGPGSLAVEGESPAENRQAERLALRHSGPLTAAPTAAGARLTDVDVPARAAGEEAYAIGTVDGGGLSGWSRKQTVVLRRADGAWRIVGPVVTQRGRVVNPRLRALATVHGGRGYAIGAAGTVVRLRGERAPLLLPRAVHSRLSAVDAAARGKALRGIAVGDRGKAVRLAGSTQVREAAGARRAKLSSVLLDGDEALASGAAGGKGVVYRRSGRSWAPTDLDVGLGDGLRMRLTSIARANGALWVTGGISDAGAVASPAEMPIAARLADGSWKTFCAGTPALAAVRELGTPTKHDICDAGLSADPSDHGAAGEVAISRHGVVVTTSRGLYVYDGRSFKPMLGYPAPYERVALSRDGNGWALSFDGRMARILRTGTAPKGSVERLPLARGGKLATIAAPASGDAVLALAGGKAALRGDQGWKNTAGPVIGLRAAAFSDDDSAWATDETGALLELENGRWSAAGEDGFQQELRRVVARALDGEVLSTDPSLGRQSGLRALAFASEGDGYAVGASGMVVHYDGHDWSFEDTPATASLNAVAASDETVLAVGDQGTLIERDGDGWHAPAEARALAGSRNFTAAAALPDGTLLAAAEGMVLERAPGESWRRAVLQPLGVPVSRLAGYRDGSGDLVVLALAGAAEEPALLEGSADGWRAVTVPAGLQVTDFALSGDAPQLWAIGHREGQPVAARIALDTAASGAPSAKGVRDALGSTAAPGAAAPSTDGAGLDVVAGLFATLRGKAAR